MEKSHCTCTERLDWTAQFTQKLEEMNQSYTLGAVSSRIAGFVCIPFVSLAEAVAHASLTVGKTCTGLVVSPWNCLANTCFPEKSLPQNLEFSSALIHLILAIECIVNAVLLPFVCLLYPSRADAWMNPRSAKPQENVENKLENDVDVNNEIEQLQQEIKDLNDKLIRAKNRSHDRVGRREAQLQIANTDLGTLREENLKLAEKLKNLPDNADLLNRIAELETPLRDSKERDSQTEKQKENNLSDSAQKPAHSGGEMKIATSRPKKSFAEIKAERELKKSQNPQAQQKNIEPPKKKSSQPNGSGPVTLDQLNNIKLKSATNKAQPQQLVSNSSQSAVNSSNNISSPQLNSNMPPFIEGFKNWEKKNNQSNNQKNQGIDALQVSEKPRNNLYNEIKELEQGKFLEEHQNYLENMSKSANRNQMILLKTNVDTINSWIDALKSQIDWPENKIEFSKSMKSVDFSYDVNNLINNELEEIISYFKAYKTALQNLRGKQPSEEEIQASQKQKTENEAANKKIQLEQLEERKKDLSQPLQFNFDMKSNEKSLIWRTCFFENKALGFSNRQGFLDSRENMIKTIDALKPEEQTDNVQYQRIKSMVSYLNDAFEKAAKK